MAVQTIRTELHDLIDTLSEEELVAAKRYVAFVRSGYADMLIQILDTATEDDEPTTPEVDQAAEQAWQEYLREGGLRSAEAKRALLP